MLHSQAANSLNWLEGLAQARCSSRKESLPRAHLDFSLVLLLHLSLEHQAKPRPQQGQAAGAAAAPGGADRARMLCQDSTDTSVSGWIFFPKSSSLAPFWRLCSHLQAELARALGYSAKLGWQSHTLSASTSIHAGTAFLHHLYFVFATSLELIAGIQPVRA